MPDVDLSYAIGLPPKEAVAYFEAKGYALSFDWREVWQEAHARAFTVAGVTKLDVLKDIRVAMGDALKQGKTLAQFRQELEPTLQRKGWLGRGQIVDPATGEVGKRLTPYRLETIYRTNMQTAYMAGRWKQGWENRDARPYGQYVAVMDARTRPEHAALNGKIFRLDDPVWAALYPPNGWRCRCRVVFLTLEEARDMGLEPEDSSGRLSEASVPSGREPDAPRVAVARFEARPGFFVSPDPGWSYNPGRAAWPELQELTARKMAAAPREFSAALAKEQTAGPGFARFYARPEGRWPIGVLKEEHARMIRAQGPPVVMLSAETMRKQLREHQDLAAAEYARVQDALDRGQVVQDTPLSLIFVLEEGEEGAGGYVTVVKATASGRTVFLSSLRRLSRDAGEKDREVKRLLSKARRR
mgnify:CR=1 FL=1